MPNNLPSRFAGSEPKFFTVNKVGGINTKSPRESIRDEQFSWLENMQPIADGNWRTLYDVGDPVYTAPGGKTLIYVFIAVIAAVPGAMMFFDDGTATQVLLVSPFTVTDITATPGTFYPGDPAFGNPMPMVAQFTRDGVVIVTTASADGYYAWDGSSLSSPGDLTSPTWLNGGTPTAMPTGINGSSVGVYGDRVWIGRVNLLAFSAPGNGADFTTGDGAGVAPSNSQFLRSQYTSLLENNGFFYVFADSSVNVISNVQTAGTGPAITTFNNQNVDPQTGTPFYNTTSEFGPSIVFSNAQGVYSLSGGTATKISDDLDGIFINSTVTSSIAPVNQPSSAVAFINDVRCYMLLTPAKGPFDSNFRNVLLIFDGKKWFVGSQSVSLTFIATYQFGSDLRVYGTDGTHLYRLFAVPSTSLDKIWQTKLWSGDGMQVTKQALRFYTQLEDNNTGFSITGTLDFELEATGVQSQALNVISGSTGSHLTGQGSISSNVRGNYLGLTMQSTSPDFTLVNHTLLYRDESPLGG